MVSGGGGGAWWQLCPAAVSSEWTDPVQTTPLQARTTTRLKPVPPQPLLRRDTVLLVCVWYSSAAAWWCGQCGSAVVGAVTDVDCERGCPPPVRWPTLLHLSFRGPSSPTSPTTTSPPRQLISPPWGPQTLSLHPRATLDSFLGCQVHFIFGLLLFRGDLDVQV